MNKQTILSIRIIIAIFWLGFFMAISFLEAPLKFTAPGLSIAEGLQIGRIVFGALNKCEWVFLIVILLTCFLKPTTKRGFYLIAIVSAILIMETAWLLPVLDIAAKKVISGQPIGGQSLHWLYIFLEAVKAPVLLLIGLESIRSKEKTPSAQQ
jgi:hypothetical protein